MGYLFNHRKNVFAAVFTLIMSLPIILVSQDQVRSIAGWEYGKFGDYWFNLVDGRQGDLVNINQVVVLPRNDAPLSNFNFVQHGLPRLEQHRPRFAGNFYELRIPANADPFKVVKKLERSGFFKEIYFSAYVKVHASPNDTHYGNQWGFAKVEAPDAWNFTKGDPSILLAIIDSGVEYTHEDLAGNIWSEIGDGFHGDNDPEPDYHEYHGTAVAGIAAATTHNTKGVAGMAGGWNLVGGARIMVMDCGYYSIYGELISINGAAQATDSAAAWGASVINMSFGSGTSYSVLQSAITNAVNDHDVVFVCSAGNNGGNSSSDKSIRYPARYSNTIAVGASNENDYRWTTTGYNGSAFGPELDVVAPGGVSTIWTTDISGSGGYDSFGNGNYTDSFGGTSASAPLVAGIAALLRTRCSSLTWSEVRDILRNTADKVAGMGGQNRTNYYGYGRVNAYKALLPAPPTNLYISGYQGGMPRINWTASTSPDIDHYELWWNEVVGPPYGWQLLATTSGTWWVDSRVTIDWYGSEDEYGYKALAVIQAGWESDFSNADYVLVDECPPWLCKELAGELEAIPEAYALEDNYPNPFNPATTIEYDLPEASRVSLVIYDVMGREVMRWEGVDEAGYRQVLWHGTDQQGRTIPAGIYIYRLVAASVESDKRFTASRKMVLLK